jgi:PAS domain S-box-containing protein
LAGCIIKVIFVAGSIDTEERGCNGKISLNKKENRMKANELLDVLPVKYYVINTEQQEIEQTNNSSVNPGDKCYETLFERQSPCEHSDEECFCRHLAEIPDSISFETEKTENGEKRFLRGEVKKLDEKRILTTFTDITNEVITRKELKINTRRLERAEKLALFGYWEIDLKREVMMATHGARDIYGVNQIEMPLKEAQAIPLEEYRKPLDTELKKLLAGEKNYDIVFEIKRPSDGETRTIHSIAEYREDKHMVFGVIRDITEKIKAERELNRTNTLLKTLIDNLPDAVYMKDVNYRKVIANRGDAKNCGVKSVEELIGKTDFELFPKATAEKYFEDDRRVIENDESILNREEELPVEPKRWILTSKIPLHDDAGNVSGLVGIGHDITLYKKMNEELREAKEKAEESDRLKSVFLANMSHEIRTPLNAILGFSNIICSGEADKSNLEYFGKIIQNSGMRLTTVIDDIIDISLIQSNQLKIKMSQFSINELLKEMFVFYQTEKAGEHPKIELKVKYCSNSEFCEIQSDKHRLYQVLKNLLDNAFKFTEQGIIEFGCSAVNSNEIELFVKDTGVGIEKEKIESVFETFRQVEEGNTRRYEGSGLGLSIVAGIVDRLEGKIRVDSEPGQGSVFYVTVPRRQENSEVPAAPEYSPQKKTENRCQGKTETRRIVSFEDDPASIEYLKSAVGLQGYELVNFILVKDGINFIRNNRADLVLMDVQLPEINGYEATKMIKSEFPELPVIIQTAYAMKGDRQKAIEAGCDDYLAKPVSLNDLKEKISRLIKSENRKN